jgi:hypothetical protein
MLKRMIKIYVNLCKCCKGILKDRRPEGGSEWELIKILLEELGLYPKITSEEFRTQLPRSRSHNRPTDPRNKLEQA